VTVLYLAGRLILSDERIRVNAHQARRDGRSRISRRDLGRGSWRPRSLRRHLGIYWAADLGWDLHIGGMAGLREIARSRSRRNLSRQDATRGRGYAGCVLRYTLWLYLRRVLADSGCQGRWLMSCSSRLGGKRLVCCDQGLILSLHLLWRDRAPRISKPTYIVLPILIEYSLELLHQRFIVRSANTPSERCENNGLQHR